ncbi:MAG: hypothetical protein V7733_00225 [Paraglaciecola polaris]|uniref:hypothetical protein n=1 Tax=Paraglaciecola polaris TaxID=222814 RepID=UPI0026CF1FA5
MELVYPTYAHIDQLMTWFKDEAQVTIWSGPNFRYPFDFASFKYDLKLPPSLLLIDSRSKYSISICSILLARGEMPLRPFSR